MVMSPQRNVVLTEAQEKFLRRRAVQLAVSFNEALRRTVDEVREVYEMHRAGRLPPLTSEAVGNRPRHGPCRAERATGLPCTRPATRGLLCVVHFRSVLAGRTPDEEIADCLALADARHERARER